MQQLLPTIFLFLLPFFLLAQKNEKTTIATNSKNKLESGDAMFYADYLHGEQTAYGEIYRMEEYTCSHNYYPQGTLLRVTRTDNGKSVTVRVNDKSTFPSGVIIYVSKAAAMQLDLVKDGRANVTIEWMGKEETTKAATSYNSRTPNSSTRSDLTAKGYSSNNLPTSYSSGSSQSNSTVRKLSGSNSGFALQLSSYQDQDNAYRQVQELQNRGLSNVFIWQNGGYYKVVVAQFSDKGSAYDYLQMLKEKYLLDGIIVTLK
ncbi:MAG TPA: septal ring lytic transglycosylase RlpA family protein [Saprospiraceae bacterium]|nr:septal ring lytic transglycosylase RlpA family protein [Saprospiraceae bacterium]HMQ82745.1 septal ring lytic transglycosylase RlpA family protein [Saprospiraceae bacterium]